jgi:hypothetical protein
MSNSPKAVTQMSSNNGRPVRRTRVRDLILRQLMLFLWADGSYVAAMGCVVLPQGSARNRCPPLTQRTRLRSLSAMPRSDILCFPLCSTARRTASAPDISSNRLMSVPPLDTRVGSKPSSDEPTSAHTRLVFSKMGHTFHQKRKTRHTS